MLLSARLLTSVSDVNTFDYVDVISFSEGDGPNDLYFQLIDASKDTKDKGFYPPGRRYIPVSDAVVSVYLENIDNTKKITRIAIAPFATSKSIWKVTILAGDALRGTYNLRISISENAGVKTTNGFVAQALSVVPSTDL